MKNDMIMVLTGSKKEIEIKYNLRKKNYFSLISTHIHKPLYINILITDQHEPYAINYNIKVKEMPND